MASIVLLVLGVGLGAAGLYLGIVGGPSRGVAVTAPTPCDPATAPALDPRKVKVNVYNATGRAGLAARTADLLRARRFAIGAVANDPAKAKVPGTSLVRYGPEAAAAAALVATQVDGAKLQADRRPGAVVDLVLGAAFTGLAPVAATPAMTCTPGPTSSDGRSVPATPRAIRGQFLLAR